jgi:hypothetical protein
VAHPSGICSLHVSTHQIKAVIRGSRVPASKMSKRVRWLDGAGLGLFKTCRQKSMDEHSLQPSTSSMIAGEPSSTQKRIDSTPKTQTRYPELHTTNKSNPQSRLIQTLSYANSLITTTRLVPTRRSKNQGGFFLIIWCTSTCSTVLHARKSRRERPQEEGQSRESSPDLNHG